ncbi:MAG: hypothetical protein ACXW2E_00175 [Nitrososphaeraceae archaeon]
MKITKQEKAIEHPLEELFNIEPNTTIVEYHEVLPEKPVEMPSYDNKDNEIELKLEEIYAVAMGQMQIVSDEMDRVEGRFKARIGEVTATMLNVALSAVREKRIMKEHKDKLSPHQKIDNSKTITNNNLVVADRNEILRMLADKKDNG